MENKNKEPLYSSKKETEEKISIDDVVNEVTNKNTSKKIEIKTHKKFLDINMSWVMLIVMAGVTFGIGYAHQKSLVSSTMNSYLYVFLFVFISFLVALISYNLGKIIFAYFCNYVPASIDFLGLRIILGDKEKNIKTKYVYKITNLFELHLSMRPKNEKAKPTIMFLGGTFFFAFVAIIVVLIALSLVGNIRTSLLFGVALGSLVVFYEIVPVKLDNLNDMFLLVNTRKEDDIKAYNNQLINAYNDLSFQMPVKITFDSYENSRMKPATLVPALHLAIYNRDYKDANKIISSLEDATDYINDKVICEIQSEHLFLALIQGQTKQADKLVVQYNHLLRNTSNYFKSSSALRTDILISGLLDNSLEEVKLSINAFNKTIEKFYSPSTKERIDKDIALANEGISKIDKVHPAWNIESIKAPK